MKYFTRFIDIKFSINFITIILYVLLSNNCLYAFPVEEDESVTMLTDYIHKTLNKGYDILKDKNISSKEKSDKIYQIVDNILHKEKMSIMALGRHRRAISEDDYKKYESLYSQYIVKVYSNLIQNYNGQEIEIGNTIKIDENRFIVKSKLVDVKQNKSTSIDYLVYKIDNSEEVSEKYKIADIITSGISTIHSQKNEFNEVISDHGIDGLLNSLKEKLKSSKAP